MPRDLRFPPVPPCCFWCYPFLISPQLDTFFDPPPVAFFIPLLNLNLLNFVLFILDFFLVITSSIFVPFPCILYHLCIITFCLLHLSYLCPSQLVTREDQDVRPPHSFFFMIWPAKTQLGSGCYTDSPFSFCLKPPCNDQAGIRVGC